MTDLLNYIMLICAVVGSMAFGVLAAYGVFRVGFALIHPRQEVTRVKAVKTQAEAVL